MHNVLRRIGDESVTDIFRWPGVAAVDGESARRREIARGASTGLDSILQSLHPPLCAHHPPRLLRADAKQGGLWPIDSDVHGRIGHGVMRVSICISPIEKMRHNVPVLPAKELSSVVVEAHAILPFARLDTQFHGSRIKSEITSERYR